MHLAHHIRSLLARGETDEAAGWLARLEKQDPGSLRTVEIQARLLKAKGRGDEAAALLVAHAQGRADDVGRVALLLDQLGQAAAEEMYRRHAAESRQPGSVLALAEYLGRHGRVPEALDLCERTWLTCPPEAVATISVAVLRAGRADGGQCQRVERRIREALGQRPGGASVFVALGEVLDLQGRYADAVTAYRQALQRDSHNVLALNNLAWLLALHADRAAEGLEMINRAIAVTGPVADLLDTRAVVYLLLGQANAAVQDLESAAAEAPSAVQYFHLAQAHQLAKNRRAAGDALQKAKAAGLREASLHPLERPAYDRLLGDLAQK